jgi:hypothetical protein
MLDSGGSGFKVQGSGLRGAGYVECGSSYGLRGAGFGLLVTRCGSFDLGFRIWDLGLNNLYARNTKECDSLVCSMATDFGNLVLGYSNRPRPRTRTRKNIEKSLASFAFSMNG